MSQSAENTESEQRRVLNLKAVALLIGGVTLLAIGISRLHASQVNRTSDYLKQTAELAMKDQDHRRAFDFYEQYLTLKPGEAEVEEILAQLLEEHGNSAKALQRAFQINERLLLSNKSRDDLRLRQIRIADRLGRYSDAAVHLQTMREQRSDLSAVWHFSGIVAADTGAFSDAMTYFAKAVALQDPIPESFQQLADLTTSEANDAPQAEALLDRMIGELDSPKSRRIRAQWLLKQGRPADAVPDLWVAVTEEPDDVRNNAMLLKSIRLAASENRAYPADTEYRRLINHLQAVLSRKPDEPGLRLYLSSALWATGEREAAISNLRTGISRDPRQFEMYEVLVDYLVSDRRHAEAQQLFDQIPDRVLDRGRREFMRGRLLMSQKQWEAAISAFDLAIGFAHDDSNLTSRARVCLALCRRETGDNVAAMDAYRSLIQANPDFDGGRLGMASAYLRADQIPMAIAEYRQLLHVDGVPAFVANLMIKYNLSLPKQQRDWSEVSDILRDENPIVVDSVQRSLLQADLLFAQGFPAQAMDHLDRAALRMPDRDEIVRARQRLSDVHGDSLQSRVLEVLDEDPRNAEGHISILRLKLARRDTVGLTLWLKNMMTGTAYPALGAVERMRLLAESASSVADAELMARGESPALKILQQYAASAWRQLSAEGPLYLRRYVRFVGMHQSASDAITIADWVRENSDVPTQAACWVECLKAGINDPAVQSKVTRELASLIRKAPQDMSLRLAYAESLILLQKYTEAEQLLTQIKDYDQDNGRAWSRLAWLASLVEQDHQKALAYSQRATELVSGDADIRSMRALAMAESNQSDVALEVLMSIPARDRSAASYVFQARALLLAGRRSAATDLVLELSQQRTFAQLDPAEARLLTRLQQELDVEPRHLSAR